MTYACEKRPLLSSVFEFIEQHCHERISLADLASAVGLTPGHLTNVVRRKTRARSYRWITERRMTEARRLLRETDLTIEVIAARYGDRQPSSFIKQSRRIPPLRRPPLRRATRGSMRVGHSESRAYS